MLRGGVGDDSFFADLGATVSVDGGLGVDTALVLATDAPDHLVLTATAISGGGAVIRLGGLEALTVDGRGGDDVIFVQSTALGTQTRVLGGWGSDTINVASSVTSDIAVGAVEAASGAVNHLVVSDDVGYGGLPAAGVDAVVRNPSVVVITQTDGTTAVGEGGILVGGIVVSVDRLLVRLASAPNGTVYVTVSVPCAPKEDQGAAPGTCLLTRNAGSAVPAGGDGIGLAGGASTPDASAFYRLLVVAGVATWVPVRSLVLAFDALDWNIDQSVWLMAFDDQTAEGDRVVPIDATVDAPSDPAFDRASVDTVQALVLDNDTPGVRVTPVDGAGLPVGGVVVVEGDAAGAANGQYTVTLAAPPQTGSSVRIHITTGDPRVQVCSLDIRFSAAGCADDQWVSDGFVTLTAADWNAPVVVSVRKRNDGAVDDRFDAVLDHEVVVDAADPTLDPAYLPVAKDLDVAVYDDDAAGVVIDESGGATSVGPGGATDDYTIRLTSRPTSAVTIAATTDGRTDVVSINGLPASLQPVGTVRTVGLFTGDVAVDDATSTVTRTTGDFRAQGFAVGQVVAISGFDATFRIVAIDATGRILTLALQAPGSTPGSGALVAATISRLVNQGVFSGGVTFDPVTQLDRAQRRLGVGRRRVRRRAAHPHRFGAECRRLQDRFDHRRRR